MLTFHPEYRITVEECLEHPYLEELHSQMDEPVADKHFDFDFEKHHAGHHVIPKPELQAMMYKVSDHRQQSKQATIDMMA